METDTETKPGKPVRSPRHDRLVTLLIVAGIAVSLVFLGLLANAFWASAHARYFKVYTFVATHTATQTETRWHTRYLTVTHQAIVHDPGKPKKTVTVYVTPGPVPPIGPPTPTPQSSPSPS